MSRTPEEELATLLRMLEDSVGDEPRGSVLEVAPGQLVELDDLGEDPAAAWLLRDRGPWERLGRLRLPWTPDTLVAALGSVLRFRYLEAHRVRPVLAGAASVCASGRATPEVLDALGAVLRHLEAASEEQWEAEELVPVARRALVAATPPDLLDLRLLVDGDTWVEGARLAAAEVPPDEAAPLVRLLGQLGPRRPSVTWSREVATAVAAPGAHRLLRRWLELAALAQPVPEWPGSRIGDCCGRLFMGTNQDLVRAAVRATACVQDETWPAPLLGVLARTGSAHNGMDGMTEALALPVASAAVDALVTRGGPQDRAVLQELAGTLGRRDLLARVGRALGQESETAVRSEKLRVSKARATRAKASPAPRKARGAMDALLRRELGPVMRDLGFRGGPRTWRRERSDRVELVVLEAHLHEPTGVNRVGLQYGAWFDAVHPPGSPYRVDRAKVRDYHLDLRLSESEGDELVPSSDSLEEPDLRAVATRLREVVVPLLDSLDDWDRLRSLLEGGDGLPPGVWSVGAGPGSPAASQLLGLLALAKDDLDLAVAHLRHAVDSARSWHEGEGRDEGTAAELAWWEDVLGRASEARSRRP